MSMKILSLFSGIGAFETALKRLNIEYTSCGYSEIDKYAAAVYNVLHDGRNLGDVTKINLMLVPKVDVVLMGFPCQSISQAGKGQGFDGESGLFRQGWKVAEASDAKAVVMENSSLLMTSKKYQKERDEIEQTAKQAGYTLVWFKMNAWEHGDAQHRQRCFIVAFKHKEDMRRFVIPAVRQLDKAMCDMLETDVDKKYYLSDECKRSFIEHSIRATSRGSGFVFRPMSASECKIAHAITCKPDSRLTGNFVITDRCALAGNMHHWKYDQWNRVYACNALSPCICAYSGGGNVPNILDDIVGLKIRKLTPREAWRLMGFDDDVIDEVMNLELSDARMYKLAGNSICIGSAMDVMQAVCDALMI